MRFLCATQTSTTQFPLEVPRGLSGECWCRGASLIELLLSLAITSILFLIAAPSLPGLGRRQKVLTESARIRLALEQGYMSALAHDATVVASFGEHGIDLGFARGPSILHLSPPTGVTVRMKSPDQKEIAFYPTHTATPATVLIESGSLTCSIVVSLRGRIRSVCV
jgi:prepilin-type N-terminal cleavage/methylation domain-containing protein